MLQVKKVSTPVKVQLDKLNSSELLQIKGGDSTSTDGIVIDDIAI